jgi:hypothetical protein
MPVVDADGAAAIPDAPLSPPGHSVEQVMGATRASSVALHIDAAPTASATAGSCRSDGEEAGVEVARSRSKQQRSGIMATLAMDGIDAAAAVIVDSAEAAVRRGEFVEHVVGARAARFPSRTAQASWKAA